MPSIHPTQDAVLNLTHPPRPEVALATATPSLPPGQGRRAFDPTPPPAPKLIPRAKSWDDLTGKCERMATSKALVWNELMAQFKALDSAVAVDLASLMAALEPWAQVWDKAQEQDEPALEALATAKVLDLATPIVTLYAKAMAKRRAMDKAAVAFKASLAASENAEAALNDSLKTEAEPLAALVVSLQADTKAVAEARALVKALAALSATHKANAKTVDALAASLQATDQAED